MRINHAMAKMIRIEKGKHKNLRIKKTVFNNDKIFLEYYILKN